MATNLFRRIAQRMPYLRTQLRRARLFEEPEAFVKRIFITSVYLSIIFEAIIFLFLKNMEAVQKLIVLLVLLPVAFIIMFSYFLHYPDAVILRREKEIGREIVFAIRFLIIELESGVPLYNALINISKSYKVVGEYCAEIIDKVNMGTTMEDAINEAVELTPSRDLRKVFWQVLNSLRTGSDVSRPLKSVLEQITKEQQILIKEYGRKLNPLAMFYMILAVIVPSLGTTMLMVIATFMGFNLSLIVLLVLAAFLGFVQFMFFQIIRAQRPAVDF